MKREISYGIALAMLLVGCTNDDGAPSVDAPPPEPPAGVWEPIPDATIWDAKLAADGTTLWWAATRTISPAGEYLSKDEVWLTATTTGGANVVAPFAIDPTSNVNVDPDLAITPTAVIAKRGGIQTLVQRYARDGQPLGAPYPLVIDDGGRVISDVSRTKLVATAGGGAQFLATVGDPSHEVAIMDLDPAGVPQTTRFAGTPDPADGGTRAYTIAAAARPDGSTLVGWDRGYNACISQRPSATLTTAVDGTGVGAIASVLDTPDSEIHPVIATNGDGAYIAWLSTSGSDTRIELARDPAVTTVIAELGEPGTYISEVWLVLGAPDRGVIAWRADLEGALHLTPFEDHDGAVSFGTPYVLQQVDPANGAEAVGLVATGDDRYVLGWIESRWIGIDEVSHLYATEIDFAGAMMRPAPTLAPPSTPLQPHWLRCP